MLAALMEELLWVLTLIGIYIILQNPRTAAS
jgi:hypothetical protein